MNYGMYLSASALRIQQQRQEVIANNLANVNTTSFKRDLTVVRSRKPALIEGKIGLDKYMPILDDIKSGLRSGGTYTDFSQGGLQSTRLELDIALQGEGFFQIDVDGKTNYTRDGRLTRDPEGYLITQTGQHRLLDTEGQPIHLPVGTVNFNSQGGISVNNERAGQLAISRFDDPLSLQKVGQNMYAADESAKVLGATASVHQRFLEVSGVEPTTALVEMLEAQRSYEAAAKMVQFADSMLGRAVNEIAKLA